LDAASADQEIAEQIAYFSSINKSFVWRAYEDDRPKDLSARLELAGFSHIGTSELMIAQASDVATGAQLPDGVSLVRANDEVGIGRLIEVHEEVFKIDQSDLRRTLLAQRSAAPALNELVVAMADGVPVSAGRVQFFPNSDFAGLWGGSTLFEWRSKGLFRSIVAYRAHVAVERGYPFLYVIASKYSRPIFQRLSFESLGSVATFKWQPG
jgi:hypothetical protein